MDRPSLAVPSHLTARPCEDKDHEILDLRFLINQMNGNQMEVSLPAHRHLADLKAAVAKEWQIPPECQRFYDGVEPLGMKDADRISKFLGRGALISLTVVVCGKLVEQLVGRLESPSSGARVAALGGLAQLGGRTTPQVEQVCNLLTADPDHRVRRAAAMALPHIAMETNEEAVLDALITRFGEENHAAVSQAIATAMAKFAPSHRDRIFASTETKLQSADAGCRRMGLLALSLAAQKGDERATAIARAHLSDSEPVVRFQALQTLVQVSPIDDEGAISSVCDCLNDECSFVKSHALAVLPDMLRTANERDCDVRARMLMKAALQQQPERDQVPSSSELVEAICVPPASSTASSTVQEAMAHTTNNAVHEVTCWSLLCTLTAMCDPHRHVWSPG